MNVPEADRLGVLVFEPKVFGDERAYFMETWRAERYEEAGLPSCFVQDSLSFSRRGVLRTCTSRTPTSRASWSTCSTSRSSPVRSMFGAIH